MCSSNGEGGRRCNHRVSRLVVTARARIGTAQQAGEPVHLSAPPERGIVHPEQQQIFTNRWPDDEVSLTIRRNLVTTDATVLTFNPATHEAQGTTGVHGDDLTRARRGGVVMAVNSRTGEYVTYTARERDGVWWLDDQADAGAAVSPRPVTPDWLLGAR